jgi:hypothetical protein
MTIWSIYRGKQKLEASILGDSYYVTALDNEAVEKLCRRTARSDSRCNWRRRASAAALSGSLLMTILVVSVTTNVTTTLVKNIIPERAGRMPI